MANGIKQFKIVINGLTESVSAVDSLNKQLDALEQKINKINSMKVSSGVSGSGSRGSNSALSEEAKLEKQIEQIEAKREAYSKEIYQNYLASKEQLNETLKDQKNIAAQERLQARTYSNTIRGMKEELRDIKEAMQTIDLSDNAGLKKMTERANELNTKLKEIEQSYGQFGRNVGNYKSAAEGFNKIKVAVGDTVREYDNYRQAMKTLRNEEFQLAQTLGKESEEYKNVHVAIKELESDYKDLSVSSQFMDNILDSMQTLTSFGQIGVGLTSIFGIEDKKYQESMTRMMGLMSVLQGIEKIKQQWDADDSWLLKPFKKLSSYLDGLGDKVTDFFTKSQRAALDRLNKTKESINQIQEMMSQLTINDRAALQNEIYRKYGFDALNPELLEAGIDHLNGKITKTSKIVKTVGTAFRWLGNIIKGVFTAGLVLFLPEIIEYLTDLVKSLDKTKVAAESAGKALNALNRQLKTRMDILSSSYLKGEISDEEYLKRVYDEQTAAIDKQIDLLKMRADAAKDNGILGTGWFKQSENADFSGKKFTGTTTVSSGMFGQLSVTVKDINEVEKAWRRANAAIKQGKDYLDMWGEDDTWYQKLKKDFGSLFATVSHTEDVLKGMGNIKLSDTIGQFQDLVNQFNEGKITTEQYAKELAKLRDVMNSNEILNSVIANLDKYIPDEKVREQVQSIINQIYELDDAFNMTSPQQVHHWNQVRIDAMKDGIDKTKAQILENQRWQIQQEAKTEEQQKLIKAKYAMEMKNAEEKYRKEAVTKAKEHAKKLNDVNDWLAKLRIENMQKGWKKREAEINLEWEQELRKAKEGGIKVKELEAEINKKYDAKIKEERIKWASDMLRIYQDLAQNIQQINKETFETETSTASKNISNKSAKAQQDTGSSMITPTNYDDVKNLENYYKKILAIKKDEVDKELAIEREKLDKELEYAKEEERIRHERAVDANSSEYANQLKEGLLTQEQYNDLIEKENLAHNARMNALDKEYLSNLNDVTREELEKVQSLYSEYYSKVTTDFSKQINKINEKVEQQPKANKWGFIDIKQARTEYDTAIKEFDNVKNAILEKKEQLAKDLKSKKISPEDFAIKQADLDKELDNIDKFKKAVKDKTDKLVDQLVQTIAYYVQQLGQSINELMSSIWDYQDYMFDKQQEELDRWNDELDKALDKQQEIVEEHRNKVNDIEDELATARGDRRQHLIDQLNAEIAAQREAAAEEKRIQKQKEQAEKKQEQLEKKRRQQEYNMKVKQAFINWHLSIASGLATEPFMPLGIAMGALATVLGAAQYALVKSQKPYAHGGQLDGGVAQGPRHSQGGIPVLGGRASIEGGEFITNRVTTAKNVELLDFINSKKKKVDLNDLIDFYGTAPKKAIKSVRTRFEDGGVVPTLANGLDISEQLQNIVVNQDNRPIVVSVVDINNKQEDVRRVQTLAGL